MFMKVSKDFLTQIKSEVKTIGPLLDILRISLRGIKIYRCSLSTSRPQNTPGSEPFKGKNDAQIIPKQLPKNSEKVQKMTLSILKMVKNGQNENVTEVKISNKNPIWWSPKNFFNRSLTQEYAF